MKISLGKNLRQVSRKDNSWNTHKKENLSVMHLYGESNEKLFQRYAERMDECADWLLFSEVKDHDRKLKLARASFCHVRHCPICQWRKSQALFARFMKNLPKYLEENSGLSYIYVVLTTRNCPMDELRTTIRAQADGVKKLLKRIQRAGVKIHGYIRTTEVTKGEDGNPHPHVNLILAVNKSYFTSASYIPKMRWVEMWKGSMGLDYDPSVHVSKVRKSRKRKAGSGPSTEQDDLIAGIQEVSKYSIKPADFVDDKEFLYGITIQCHKQRFISTGGCFKDIFKNGAKDAEDISSDEMLLKNEESEDQGNGFKQVYLWYARQGYLLRARKKFSNDKVEAEIEFRNLLPELMRERTEEYCKRIKRDVHRSPPGDHACANIT